MKGKPLLPTLRQKKRYVVYEVISGKDIDFNRIFPAIQHSYKECFGIFGLGKAGLHDMRIYDRNAKRGVLKINHKYVDNLRAALGMMTEIAGEKAIVHTVGVSGILRKTKIKYMS